jgi:hypothetical protein
MNKPDWRKTRADEYFLSNFKQPAEKNGRASIPKHVLPFQVLYIKAQSQGNLMINEKRDRETRQLPYNSGIK